MFCGSQHFTCSFKPPCLYYVLGFYQLSLLLISALTFPVPPQRGKAHGLKDLAEFIPWGSSGNGRTGSSKPSSPPCTGAAIMRLKEGGEALEGLRPIANQTWHETLIRAFCAGSDSSGWWDSGLNPCAAKSYFLLMFMILLLTTDNLLNDLRETSLEECPLTFAEEVINTSHFC